MTNIKKDYFPGWNNSTCLQGIDLQIEKGEFIGIWGPSGSGKTTLLNLIGAIDEPTEGNLAIAGTDVHSLSDNKRSELRNDTIGYVFQGFNWSLFSRPLKMLCSPFRFKAPLPGSKREGPLLFARGGPHRVYSSPSLKDVGRAAQRVAIARALVNGPSLVMPMNPQLISIRKRRVWSFRSCGNWMKKTRSPYFLYPWSTAAWPGKKACPSRRWSYYRWRYAVIDEMDETRNSEYSQK